MLRKIVSTASRDMREGEVEGWDYYFMSKNDILKLNEEKKLMQFIDFNGNLYGYEASEFDNLDELIVVCGGSGSGKDTTFNYLFNEKDEIMWNDKNTGFLFSIPETLELFVDYGKSKGISVYVLYMFVSEEERFKRIVKGDILKNKELSERLGLTFDNLQIFVKGEHFSIVDVFCQQDGMDSYFQYVSEVRDIITAARERVFRDREDPFETQIKELENKGLKFDYIDCSGLKVEEVAGKVKNIIKEKRNNV